MQMDLDDMQNKIAKATPIICLLGSLLLHFILLVTFAVGFQFSPKLADPPPADSVSAYLEQSHTQVPNQAESGSFEQPAVPLPQPQVESSKIGIEKPVKEMQPTPQQTRQAINRLKQVYDVSAPNSGDPVHMIGDKNKAVQPLLKLLGIALTHNLLFPKSAIDFNIRGTALLGFMLYPDGHMTDIHLVKSSSAGVLDQAALDALTASSPLKNISHYLSAPQYMVIGIIFG